MALCTIALGIYFYLKDQDVAKVASIGWLPIVALCIFIIMFSFGFGPVPWLMMGEIFPEDIKGIGGSLAGTMNWLLAFLITKTFGNLRSSMGTGGTFWLFSGLTIVGAIFVFVFLPETKGKSLQEIQAILSGNKAPKRDSQETANPHDNPAYQNTNDEEKF